jgi:predicted PurR-regulated permease PerM
MLIEINILAQNILLLAQSSLDGFTIKDLGQFAGIVVTVLLFLRYMSVRDDKIEKMFDQVMDRVENLVTRVENIQKSAEAHINTVQQEFLRTVAINQAQMQKLFDDYMQITRKNVELVVELKAQLEQLKK